MAAVEPDFAAGGRQIHQRPLRQPVQPRRPIGLDHAGLVGGGCDPQARQRAQGRDGEPCILELMAAIEPRRRQIDEPDLVLIDQTAAFFRRGPVLAGDLERRA